MAKGGKVQHWKHGWIPLTPEARAFAAGTGPRPGASTPERSKARQAWRDPEIESTSGVASKQVGGFRITTVDDCPEVKFKEVVELDRRPPEQYREVAKVVQGVLKDYPRATANGPLTFAWSNELADGVMADTSSVAPYKVRLNPGMWDAPEATMADVADMKGRGWGVFADAPDLESFRQQVITHEIGHVLHMQDEEENKGNGEFTFSTISRGEIDKFTDEAVTPKEMGFQTAASYALATQEQHDDPVDTTVARWQADTLGRRSVYATTSKYEFFAEAFLDGTINGDKASASGKRAVAIAQKIFAPEGTS